MTKGGHESIDATVHKTHEWLSGVARCLPGIDKRQAYAALRAVLHALRDRLTVDQAAHLGAQLPMLIRGIFYEGWHPAGKPLKIRNQAEFLAHVEAELSGELQESSDEIVRAVFRILEQHLDVGETNKVVAALPKALRELWAPPVEPRDS